MGMNLKKPALLDFSLSDCPQLSSPHSPHLKVRRTWDPLLQCWHMHTSLLQQQNTKKCYETKNNCACVVGANSGPKRYKEDPPQKKNPTETFEEPGAKKSVKSKTKKTTKKGNKKQKILPEKGETSQLFLIRIQNTIFLCLLI